MRFVIDLLRTILDSIAVALGGLFQSRTTSRPAFSSSAQRLKGVIACVVILLASAWIYFKLRTPAVKVQLDGHELIGQLAATETARLLGGQGGIVVVGPEDARYDMAVEAQIKSFLRTVKKQGGISVLATERFKLTTQQRVAGLTPELYLKLLGKYPNAAAVVSFIGVGQFADDDLEGASPRKPLLVSVSLNSFPPKKLFRTNLVRLAIGPRFDRAGGGVDTKTPQGWFGRYFQTITPETAGNLPR